MIIAIVGPTGVGKTDLSLFLAKKINGEIINADSTQIYKELDIATGKVKDMQNVKHHLLSFKNLEEEYTVSHFQKDARNKIDDILKRGKIPILVGGTGLYVKAVLYDYQFTESKIKNDYSKYSNEELYNKLIKIDPNTSIHQNNRQRMERALDYYAENEELLSNKKSKMIYDALIIGLTADREILYQKINQRVLKMVDEGLINEAKKIYDLGIRTKAIMTPIGYKELFSYFEGKEDLNSCLELIKKRSRNYAKRQYTWFNNQMNVKWFDVNYENFQKTCDNVYEYVKNSDLTNKENQVY